jgi:phospholipid/cholesterol/gamma-HCH transport system substrate-binding protein
MIGIGAFVIGGVLLFAAALFMIGERQNLFTKQFVVYAEFARLNGLQDGAIVEVAGMSAGEVKAIQIPAPGGKFRVRLRIREDLHPLVRSDSIAAIRTEGLVGSQFVLVTAGSEQASRVPDGGTIASREPFNFADLLDQASQTVQTVNEAIATLRADLERAVVTIADTAHNANELINDVGTDIRAIAHTGAKVATDVEAVTEGVRAGRGSVGQLFVDDALYQRMKAIAAQAEQTATNVREASEKANQLLTDVSKPGGAAAGLTTDVRETLSRAKATLENLAQNTEALKHNWFFSGYFKRRGYYTLGEISPQDYRNGALEKDGRTRLRVWLDASDLFVTRPGGELALADGAAAKLDAAMTDFLQYAGSVPFVVEGYAQSGGPAERFVESRRRAAVVRDFLLDRFALIEDSVGVMPLGSTATGSPSGDKWDGVAIAAFVPKSVLKKKGK